MDLGVLFQARSHEGLFQPDAPTKFPQLKLDRFLQTAHHRRERLC